MGEIEHLFNSRRIDRIIQYRHTGGQQVNGAISTVGIRVSHPDIEVVIEVNHHRTEHANFELANTLFMLALTELLK